MASPMKSVKFPMSTEHVTLQSRYATTSFRIGEPVAFVVYDILANLSTSLPEAKPKCFPYINLSFLKYVDRKNYTLLYKIMSEVTFSY